MGKKRDGIFQRGGFWYLRTDPVTGKKRATGCRSKTAARAYRNQRELAAADPTYAAAESATLGQWMLNTIEAKKVDRSESTIKIYKQKLGHFVRLWGVGLPLVEINTGLCDEYTKSRREEGVTDHTISKEFNCLSQVLKHATRAGCYSGQIALLRPMDVLPRYEPRKRAMPPAEVDALMQVCSPRLAGFVAIAIALGARLSEVLKFEGLDIDKSTGTWVATIRGTKTKKSRRRIPILKAFRGFIEIGAPYLPMQKYNNICRDLERACTRAGIVKVTPNDVRRSMATILIEAGVSLDMARRIYGHSTTRMLETVYGQPRPEAIAEVVEPSLEGLFFASSGDARKADRPVDLPKQGPQTVYSNATLLLAGAYNDVMMARKAA
jgi:integrase